MTDPKPEYALATRPTLTPNQWQMIEAIAPAMHKSHLFGVTGPDQAAAIMLKGYELGLTLTASFEFVAVIKGKPALVPRGALALIQQSNELAELEVEDLTNDKGPVACRVRMKRMNGFEYEITFSIEDAKRAGLVKPDSGWEKYPANMLRWRAIGFCADVVFPDVIGGMKRADELGADISEDGDVLDGQWRVSEPAPTDEPESPMVTLDALVEQWGADAVLVANDGKIPATDQECVAVLAKLEIGDAEPS